MLTERLMALLAGQGATPDYPRLAEDALGIRGAPPALARKLVEQALLLTDWRERWREVGRRAVAEAPDLPGVYVFRDTPGSVLYVGKAASLRRRLTAHFGSRRWLALRPELARVASVASEPLGSELEAILREAALIRELRPVVNVQIGEPSLSTRAISRVLVRDVVLLLPSLEPDTAVVVAARASGATLMRRVPRVSGGGADALAEVWTFFLSGEAGDGCAPLVFSWLAGRGRQTTRLDPHDFDSRDDFHVRLAQLLADDDLFRDRIVVT